MKEAKRQLKQEASKRLNLDVEKTISNASSLRDQVQAPLRMSLPLFLSGKGAGRSIVKSCLALAYEAGVSIDDCEIARQYLEGKADACFGHCNESDLVKNRPAANYFHCICVSGNPACNHIIAYVEYFGYLRIVVRLSDNYRGNSFDICYAIDPVSGEQLDLDVALEFSQKDIPAILAGEKLDEEKAEIFLKSLMATCLWHLMLTHALESANEACGVDSNQELSGELLDKWTNSFTDSLARALLNISPNHALSLGDVKENGEESTR